MSGFVSIVGAGPGDPELLTLAAVDRLSRADVVIVDYLVNPAVLLHCAARAEIIARTTGPRGGADLDQDRVNALMVEHAGAGKFVVRLKGGDPCMFGRGAEEAETLRSHGIAYEFVAGVSSPIAAPEYAGIPVTHRNHTPAVTFVSGYEAYEKAGLAVAWSHLAASAGTIVLMMSVRNAGINAQKLIDGGRAPETPAAMVRLGTRGVQQVVEGTLATLAERIAAASLRPPAVMVVGDVVKLRETLAWAESRPLFGRRVVVTRPRTALWQSVVMLTRAGADAVPIPSLELVPPPDVVALDGLVAGLRNGFAGVIVSSRHGVAALFESLSRQSMDVRELAGRHLVAVGPVTAAACTERGLKPDLVPDAATSEGLVDALAARGWLGQAWLHVRSATGRDLLQSAIEAAGGRYVLGIGYASRVPAISSSVLDTLRPDTAGGEGCDAICFASGQTARNFVATLRAAIPEHADSILTRARIVAIGPVTARAVEELGLEVAEMARAPTDAALIAAVRDALRSQPVR